MKIRINAADGLGTHRYSDPADMERTEYEDASLEPFDPACLFDYDPEEMERLMRWRNLGVRFTERAHLS
jgi:hypothetical protein